MSAIVVEGLRKSYGDVVAVDGVDLRVEEGEVFGLLGPNGAGKTTTVEVLEGHRTRSAGRVSVLGFDPATGGRRFRERIGIVLQAAGIDAALEVGEAVELFAGLYRRPRAPAEVLDLVGLAPSRGVRVGTLSGGQRRRLDLALGLVGRPDLLFLDEPTTGFDPSARRRAWDLVAELGRTGTTVLLTTHYMEEAQRLADRVAVLARGRVVAEGAPSAIGPAERPSVIRFILPAGVSVEDLPGEVRGAARLREAWVELRAEDPTAALHALTGWALARGEALRDLTVAPRTLEDVYLELTGAEAADGDG